MQHRFVACFVTFLGIKGVTLPINQKKRIYPTTTLSLGETKDVFKIK